MKSIRHLTPVVAAVLMLSAVSASGSDRRPQRAPAGAGVILLDGVDLNRAPAGLAGIRRLVVARNEGRLVAQGTVDGIGKLIRTVSHRSLRASNAADTNEAFLAEARRLLGGDAFTDGNIGVMLPGMFSNSGIPLAPTRNANQPPAPDSTIFSDDFEGAFDSREGGNWVPYIGANGQSYYWGKTSCDAYSGNSSADAVRGGTNGASLSCSANYPSSGGCTVSTQNCLQSWLKYKSSFSLAGTSGPTLTFDFRGKTSSVVDKDNFPYDYLAVYFSKNDLETGPGYYWYGNWSPSWYLVTLDLTNWPVYGDLRNSGPLYFWLYFQSTSLAPSGYGFRVDDAQIATAGSGCHLAITNADTSACPVIKLTVTPTDDTGQGIPNLGASNFSLTEDQTNKSISVACGSQNTASSNLTLLIDESGSLGQDAFNNEVSAAKSLVGQLPSNVSVAVYFFNYSPGLLIDFTTDHNAVITALTNHTYSSGGTAIYDALITSSSHYAGRSGQRLTVLMTDGKDENSSNTETAAIASANSNGVVVYTIGFGADLQGNTQVLEEIASQTGGQFYYGGDSTALQAIVNKIGANISSQCTITYTTAYTSGTHTDVVSLSSGSCQTSAQAAVTRSCSSGGGCRLQITGFPTATCPAVAVAVSATDSAGNPLSGLGSSNFTLVEDGQSRNFSAACTGGSCTLTYTSSNGGHSLSIGLTYQGCTSTTGATIDVSCPTSGCTGTYFYFVPAGAHAAGINNTQFVTDMVIANEGAGTAALVISELIRGQENSNPNDVSVSIGSGASLEMLDVFLTRFGQSSVAAALRICSTQPLRIFSRTFNSAASGTFGQGIPGYPSFAALTPGDTGHLLFLYENAQYRANVGFVNITSQSITITARFLDSQGILLGTKSYPLRPYEYVQRSQIFHDIGFSSIANARVLLSTNAGAFFGYASLVDNGSGDPTFENAEP